LRGGAYPGFFYSKLTGTQHAPITVRSYPGERAILVDFRPEENAATLNIRGAWTIYRDFDVTNVSPMRLYQAKVYRRPTAVEVVAPNIKLVNLVIHDAGTGIGFWEQAIDSEVYGCIIFNGGQFETAAGGRGHGHGIYTQNSQGTKRIADNLIFNQFGWGIHVYPNPGDIDGFVIEGNAAFENGRWAGPGLRYNNLMVAGYSPFDAERITVESNYLYHSGSQKNTGKPTDANACFGCYDPNLNGDLNLSKNYFFNGIPTAALGSWSSVESVGNTTVAPGTPRPSGVTAIVRPNQYDPGRAHIIVFNWSRKDFVDVPLSGTLQAGDAFEIRSAQNYRGTPVVRGVYSGGAVRLPLNALTVAPPVGMPPGAIADSEFQAFLVQKAPPTPVTPASALVGSYRTPDGQEALRVEREGDLLFVVPAGDAGAPRIPLSPLVDRVYRLEGLPEGVVAYFEPVSPGVMALILVARYGAGAWIRGS
jgi:hypothetical protein